MILIVASRFDKSEDSVVESLIAGAKNILSEKKELFEIVRVAGANEIPVTIQHFVSKYPEKFSVVIALGLIIKGDTDHYEMVRDSVTMGITHLSLQCNVPIIQGVLACHNKEQAVERKSLGEEFAETALEMKKIKLL